MKNINRRARWIFDDATTPSDERRRAEEIDRQRLDERLRSTPLFKSNTATAAGAAPSAPRKDRRPPEKKKSARTWQEPLPADKVHEMVVKDPIRKGRCCRLRCTERFISSNEPNTLGGISSQYNQDLLARQQAIFKDYVTEEDRKSFTIRNVPEAQLSHGSMYAANSPVCNFAYMKFFGVTSTLISSCKGTEKARASRSAARYVFKRTSGQIDEEEVHV